MDLSVRTLRSNLSICTFINEAQDVNWWTGVVWIIVMCLSDSHSDGTHSLQSIHCWDTDADTFLQTWWRNKLILILDELRVSIFSDKVNFGELFLYWVASCAVWAILATWVICVIHTVHAHYTYYILQKYCVVHHINYEQVPHNMTLF